MTQLFRAMWLAIRALRLTPLAGLAVAVLIASAMPVPAQQSNPSVRPPADAVVPAEPAAPDAVRPWSYDHEMWQKLRGGAEGKVSIPDSKAGQMIDSSGEAWRNVRNGPLPTYGAWLLAGTIALIAVFFLLRGRIKVEHGWSGRTIERFNSSERMGHWLLATSFIVLALTGLNVLYGRYVLLPVIGKAAFAAISMAGKLLHNYVAFAFMLGLLWVLVTWVRHNIPHWRDLQWIAMGGGMLVKGVHPPSWKFNAGQKILFWLIILGGISISLSGLSLMFPYELPMFAKTFAAINSVLGTELPATLTINEEMQYASIWHAAMGVFLTAVIIGHIYIGTLGMQGAFDAMGSGQVDVAWAKQHHKLWAEEALKGGAADLEHTGATPQPAE
ncbi:MAG: formate dehydrogenase subunit gamma [Hyphomicrobiaceae bacterium]|nr:formate dehydrogenase subunit gamma [Hyphomicrobiaceae bacterium]